MSTYLFFIVLQSVATELDDRVTELEEDGGGGGNSSVAELEVRVETLEGTAADHETRLIVAEENIQGRKQAKIVVLNVYYVVFFSLA